VEKSELIQFDGTKKGSGKPKIKLIIINDLSFKFGYNRIVEKNTGQL